MPSALLPARCRGVDCMRASLCLPSDATVAVAAAAACAACTHGASQAWALRLRRDFHGL